MAHHPLRTQNSSQQCPSTVSPIIRSKSRDRFLKFHKAYPETDSTAKSPNIVEHHCGPRNGANPGDQKPGDTLSQSPRSSQARGGVRDLDGQILTIIHSALTAVENLLLPYKFGRSSWFWTCYRLLIVEMDPKTIPSPITWSRGTKTEHNVFLSAPSVGVLHNLYVFIDRNRDIEGAFSSSRSTEGMWQHTVKLRKREGMNTTVPYFYLISSPSPISLRPIPTSLHTHHLNLSPKKSFCQQIISSRKCHWPETVSSGCSSRSPLVKHNCTPSLTAYNNGL